MKSIIIATAIAALGCTTATAQLGPAKKIVPVVSLGLKAGLNLQQVSGTNLDNAHAAGIVGGAFVSVSKKKMGVRVEGLVKSARIDYTIAAPAIKTVGLDVPVLFEYSVIKRLKLHAGPQFTTILSAEDVNGLDVKSQMASAEIAVAAGLEVNLPLKFTVGARYIKGLTDIDKTGVSDVKTSTIQVTVGYRFLN